MASQEHVGKSNSKSEPEEVEAPSERTEESKAKTDMASDIDALLDDIDDVLGTEKESESLVSGYHQKGGE